MNVKMKFLSTLKCVLLLSFFISFSRCTNDDELISPTPENVSTSSTSEPLSISVSGIHEFSSSTVDCKACQYIVPANTLLVDGETLGLQPGDFICLDAALKYGSLEFTNLKGEIDNPIVIAHCDSRAK